MIVRKNLLEGIDGANSPILAGFVLIGPKFRGVKFAYN
jgi:hypothetical protein